MIDFRHETFLALCQIGSYTKTAEQLHITQPAVTQHIQYLEEYYGGKLFSYRGRSLTLTERGRLLRDYVQTLSADSRHIKALVSQARAALPPVVFGATLSIGEYVMPAVIARLLESEPALRLTMQVDNTERLLQKLRAGEIAFALVEGFFDRAQVCARLFSRERFIPVCAPSSTLARDRVPFERILGERVILREQGSGTREILEQQLKAHNLTVESFAHVTEIANMSAIKQLVYAGAGISFMYKAAARQELADGRLCELQIEHFNVMHDFSFIFLRGSVHEGAYLAWYDRLKALRAQGL